MKTFIITLLVLALLFASFVATTRYAIEVWQKNQEARRIRLHKQIIKAAKQNLN